jgi:hypothetical protein
MLQMSDEVAALSPVLLPSARLRTSLYADDVALFVKPNATDIHHVAEILKLFGDASGITSHDILAEMCRLSDNMQHHGNHLYPKSVVVAHKTFCLPLPGPPSPPQEVEQGRATASHDKVVARFPRWRGKLLNTATRLALVNSVLSAIPIYMLTIFKLGKWKIKRIDKIRRDFLLKTKNDGARGVCLVNWKSVCWPKCLGGLGI